jgi:catechol 2,3-dioxygenase-like lactoylglutathione lyase family enzyme
MEFMVTVLLMPSPRLYRVITPVDDIESATRFYSTLFGPPGVRVSPGRHYFACGAVTLALYSPKADGDARTARPNFDHVYFAVDDLDDVYERAKRLGGLSVEIGDGQLPMGQIAVRPWGERSFYMSDPFGNPLCFVDARTVFSGTPE